MNLVIENYNRGVQITWQVYTPEEIAENPSLGMVQLYYFPAKTANAKYAIVVPGNGGNTTAELNEGASIANQLHELGYAAFVLRYRSFLNASDNAPLYDIANAVKYLTENADQFGVQRENYALMGFSSGGHIVGLIGSDNEKFGYKAFGLPQPAALLLGYPINDFFEVKPLYQLAIDPLVLGWRYYWTDISDVVNENFTPTYFFYGKMIFICSACATPSRGRCWSASSGRAGLFMSAMCTRTHPTPLARAATPMRTAGSCRQRNSGKNSANKEINGGLL